MSRPSYLPTNDKDFDVWLKNFYAKLVLYATQFGITTAELAAVLADSNMVTYVVAQLAIQQNELQKRFEYKRTLFDAELGATLGAFPTYAAIAVAPTQVPAGIVKRLVNMVTRIKGMPSYTENIGYDFGIIPPKTNKLAKTVEKPVFSVSTNADHPFLKIKKNGAEAVNIYVDHGDGKGFVLLCGCPRAKYIDMHPLPDTLTNWTYKIIYTKGGVEYGLFSDASSIAVISSLSNGSAK